MNTVFDRRGFLKAATAFTGAAMLSIPQGRAATAKARVVVVGGGYGGATAAKYLRLLDPGIDVTLIERGTVYTSCPLSNEVVSGAREIDTIQTGYDRLAARGVNVVHDEVTAIDPVAKTVATAGGRSFGYDSLVVSPGIEFDYDAVAGLSREISETRIPHAWKAGPQTLLLRRQLEAMEDGGVFVIAVPKGPFRCPPGPYERAAQVAMHCLHHGKKKSKVIILDANDGFAKKPLFEESWRALYGYGEGGMIEWVPAANDGKVEEILADEMIARTTFDDHKADVLNLIPPHRAGRIARDLGLADAGGKWCSARPQDMESLVMKDVHVIGDACTAGELAVGSGLPKSAHMANSQGKIVAAALAAKYNGQPAPTPIYTNTCYSVVAHDWGFSVVHLFRVEGGKWIFIKEGSGISPTSFGTKEQPKPVPRIYRKMEAEYADGWLRNLMADSFG